MTPTAFATYIRTKTKTNSTTFTDASILAFANAIKDELSGLIIKTNEDYFGFEMVRNLEADKRNYAFDTTILSQMKYLQAKFDGSSWSNDPLFEYDIAQLKINTDEASIIAAFNEFGWRPGYFIFGGEIILLNSTAIIDVVNGLKMWLIVYPEDISSLSGSDDMSVRPSDTTAGFPRQMHKLWADMVVIDYKGSKDKPLPLTAAEKNIDQRKTEMINSIKQMNMSRSYEGTIPYNDGSQY